MLESGRLTASVVTPTFSLPCPRPHLTTTISLVNYVGTSRGKPPHKSLFLPLHQLSNTYPRTQQRPVHDANQGLLAACIPSTGEHDGRLISTSITTSSPSSPPYSIPLSFSSSSSSGGVLSLQCSLLRYVLILLIAIIFQQLIISGDIETNPGPGERLGCI